MSPAPEAIHQRGRAAILAGQERLDTPPRPGDPRWGLSVIARPDPAGERLLAALTGEVMAHAGSDQWPTGRAGSSHLTVAYAEPTYRHVGADDPGVRTHGDLLQQVTRGLPPLRFRLTGVALAEGGVLAVARPVDDTATLLRGALLDRLPHGAEEAAYRGDTWWSTLVHFAAPVADRAGLVAWADARVATGLGELTADRVELVHYVHDGRQRNPAVRPGNG